MEEGAATSAANQGGGSVVATEAAWAVAPSDPNDVLPTEMADTEELSPAHPEPSGEEVLGELEGRLADMFGALLQDMGVAKDLMGAKGACVPAPGKGATEERGVTVTKPRSPPKVTKEWL